ncbi:hypothetical protein ACQP2F_15550 [Actinoplanes sp. CA-030573]|uniref:hypothetical protein n=1 Tax=Actinoplanes sp. CA-030573 TaxID=3239898 RepID=UPI003D903698
MAPEDVLRVADAASSSAGDVEAAIAAAWQHLPEALAQFGHSRKDGYAWRIAAVLPEVESESVRMVRATHLHSQNRGGLVGSQVKQMVEADEAAARSFRTSVAGFNLSTAGRSS